MLYISMVKEINKLDICWITHLLFVEEQIKAEWCLRGIRVWRLIEGRVVECQMQHHLGSYIQGWELLRKYLTGEKRRVFHLPLPFNYQRKKIQKEVLFHMVQYKTVPALHRKESNSTLKFSPLPSSLSPACWMTLGNATHLPVLWLLQL